MEEILSMGIQTVLPLSRQGLIGKHTPNGVKSPLSLVYLASVGKQSVMAKDRHALNADPETRHAPTT
jgi:hypothetical protein